MQKICYLKEQQAAATCFFTAHLLPFLSASFNASHSVNLPGSECLETMHQSLHKERVWHLLSSCSPVGLAAAPCSGLSRQQPDPWTTVWLPGAKSSNDRPLPLKQSQGHTGTERPVKTRVLTGTEEEGEKNDNFLKYVEFFPSI